MANFQNPMEKTLIGHILWNYSALVLMAGTGVILNIFIVIQFGLETLGIFNQIYAIYIVAARLAVFGLHDSAQKFAAEYHSQEDERHQIARTASLIVVLIGILVAGTIYLTAPAIGHATESTSVGLGMTWAAPGLFFFALNKVQLGILNGNRQMRVFAIIQGLRVIIILSFVVFVHANNWPDYMLGASFTVAEIIISGPLLILVRPWKGAHSANKTYNWCYRHISFGGKALPNGFLSESYLRIDILMLAIFVSDEAVGIYSFAAMLIEGLYQVPVVFRTVINPILVTLLQARNTANLARFCRRVMVACIIIFTSCAILILVIFPFLEPYFPSNLIGEAYPVLLILTFGLATYAAFIPLEFILMQGGQPGWQSTLMSWNIFINAGLNLILVPNYGIDGAALATAIAFALSSLSLNFAVWWRLGLSGGFLLAETRLLKSLTSRAQGT